MLANLTSYVYVGKLAVNDIDGLGIKSRRLMVSLDEKAIRQMSRANGVSKRHWSSTLRTQQQVIGFESVPIYTSGLAVDVVGLIG